jgi:uncharacterized protein DUF3105
MMPNAKVNKSREKPTETWPKLRRRTKRRLAWAGAVLAGIAVFLAVYFWASARPGQWVASLGNEHIQTAEQKHVPYNSDPPTSGPHLPYIAAWGVHVEPIPKELQVHNLEEGGVLVQYDCTAPCPELMARLRSIVLRYNTQVILAPYPGMNTKIALTAWTRIDKLDQVDEKRIIRFIDAYRSVDHHPRGSLF